jgi:CubicO group peptidase (beta-lactamase class C family)
MSRQINLRKTRVFCLVLSLVPGIARADQIDDFIRAEMKRQKIPGLSVAIVRGGQVIKAEGYGVADIQRKTPAKPETVYKIASVSKQFISTGIMLLVQEGRLGLSMTLSASIWKERQRRGKPSRSAIC